MSILDAYAHVALPRFMSADEFLRVMDENGVAKAHVCTAETCPDLAGLSRAAAAHPDRLIVSGLPLGDDPAGVRASVEAQLDSGFAGLRVPEDTIARDPALLDILGRHRATPFIVGAGGLPAAAAALAAFLDRYPECIACAPHFAGAGSPDVLDRNPDVRRLFGHERFFVIFSRHGAFDPARLRPWAEAVVRRVGWNRIMFGSEYPVALFRGETYASTARWPEDSGLGISPEERRAFLHDNARRHLFSRPVPPARPLDPKWVRPDLGRRVPVWLFPSGTLDLPEQVSRRLLAEYLAGGGERSGGYREFIARKLGESVGFS